MFLSFITSHETTILTTTTDYNPYIILHTYMKFYTCLMTEQKQYNSLLQHRKNSEITLKFKFGLRNAILPQYVFIVVASIKLLHNNNDSNYCEQHSKQVQA